MNNAYATQKEGFFLGTFGGGFLAATKSEPYFCVYADTEEGAVEAGLAALKAYYSFKRGIAAPKLRVVSQTSIKSQEPEFVPTKIVFVDA